MTVLLDSHVHLDAPEFACDLAQVLARSRAVGVSGWVVPAVAQSGFARLRKLAQEISGLMPAYGLHPLYLDEHREAHLENVSVHLAEPSTCAVGECGLDYFVPGLDQATQEHYFFAQLKLARDFDLPVIVHARRATEAVLLALRRFGVRRGVIHSYGGSMVQAEQLIALGLHLGFGGPITYPRASKLRLMATQLPIEHLLLETDAPDQPLYGHQGKRNEPAQLPQVLAIWAELRGCEPSVLGKQLSANAKALFTRVIPERQ